MAYTLNTGHALYGNLLELIGVQSGALVSHKTARTFTPESGSSYGSGGWGEHFSTVYNGYSTKGVSFTPSVSLNSTTTTSYTVLAVFNGTGTATTPSSQLISLPGGGSSSIKGPGKTDAGLAMGARLTGVNTMGTGQRMLTYCRIGETAAKLYNNKVKDVDATGLANDWNDTTAAFSFIGGFNGQYSMSADLVWLAVFDKELSSTEISDLYDSLGASNAFGLVSAGDTTAPTLTSPSVTAVAATTATGNVTTNEGNGTLYGIVSTSATAPSSAQIQAGQNHTGAAAVWAGNQAVSTTGAKTFSITGLTASTAYYFHAQHKDAANNNSTVATSAQFTTGSTDTTVPTLTGSVTISSKTTTSYTATWPSGSDNVAVTGYEYRLNAGSWVDVGNVLTIGISARTPGSTDTFEVRAYDAAGNKSTPALSVSVTLLIGTITIPAVKDWSTGNLKTAQTGVQVDIHNISTGALVVRKTGQTTHATTGVCVVQDAALSDATTYEVITRFADGSKGMWDYTASLT